MSDKYSTKRGRASTESLRNKASGGKLPMFKIKNATTELFILCPVDPDADVVFTTYIHRFTEGWGKNFKILKQCASPAFTQEQDSITDLGWKLREEYGNSDSKAKAGLWKQLVADSDDHVVVLDIANPQAGAQIFKMPHTVKEYVVPYLDDVMDRCEGDLHDVCHPEEGKVLVISTNGQDGLNRKYTNIFFDDEKPACLFSDNIVTEQEYDGIVDRQPKMDKILQPKYVQAEFDAYLDFCYEEAERMGINLDDLGAPQQEEISYSDPEPEAVPARSGRGSRGEEAPARSERGSRQPENDYSNDTNLDIGTENEAEPERPSERGGRASASTGRGGRATTSTRTARGGRAR